MNVLGIESSCDETAVSVVVSGHKVLANIISSQVSIHSVYGGVVPELASREHLRNIDEVCRQALNESQHTLKDIDAIAVTTNPGLLPALLVGTSFARGLAVRYKLPLVGVNHLLAHIYAGFISHKNLLEERSTFPLICLLVSGGHTNLLVINQKGKVNYIGGTLDDAVGEAYDKVARLLKLSYPGGPIIDKLADKGDPTRFKLPRPLSMKNVKTKLKNRFNFSFSGIKSAVYYLVKDKELSEQDVSDICASFQEAIVDILLEKTLDACNEFEGNSIILGGGVACNSSLRQRLVKEGEKCGKRVILTPRQYCTDNAVMIAGLGYYELLKKTKRHNDDFTVHNRANINDLEQVTFVLNQGEKNEGFINWN